MPVISKFYGITIKIYFRSKEHNPPHIHAFYGDYVGVFSLVNDEMFEGEIPNKEQQMIIRFIKFYRNQLVDMWNTQVFEMLPPIE